MPKIKVAITAHDIAEAASFKITNPILFVLQNTTGTLWKIYDDGTVCELMKPHRSGRLSTDALKRWREYSTGRKITPFEFEMELDSEAESKFQDGDEKLDGKLDEKSNGNLAANGSADGFPSTTKITLRIAPDDWEENGGDLDNLLLRVLQRRTATPWRAVCPSVFVERVEPYNTVVLRAAVLKELRAQQALHEALHARDACRLPSDAALKFCHFTAEFHAPLATSAAISEKSASQKRRSLQKECLPDNASNANRHIS